MTFHQQPPTPFPRLLADMGDDTRDLRSRQVLRQGSDFLLHHSSLLESIGHPDQLLLFPLPGNETEPKWNALAGLVQVSSSILAHCCSFRIATHGHRHDWTAQDRWEMGRKVGWHDECIETVVGQSTGNALWAGEFQAERVIAPELRRGVVLPGEVVESLVPDTGVPVRILFEWERLSKVADLSERGEVVGVVS